MKKKSNPPHLALHTLLSAVSYWGVMVRAILVSFVLIVALMLAMSGGGTFWEYVQRFMYLMCFYVLLDAGYVTIARIFPVKHAADKAVLLAVLALAGAMIILPYFVLMPWTFQATLKYLPFLVIITLALRTAAGVISNNKSA